MRFVNWVKALMRPVVTIGLVGAFIYFAKVDVDAALIVGPPAMLVLGWWFKERGDKPPPYSTIPFEPNPEDERLDRDQAEAMIRETNARAAKLESELLRPLGNDAGPT